MELEVEMTTFERALAFAIRAFTLGQWGRDVYFALDRAGLGRAQGLQRDGDALVGNLGPYRLVIDRC